MTARVLVVLFAATAIFAPRVSAAEPPAAVQQPESVRVDVLVYGGTPGGIAAAVTAARAGRSVLLVDKHRWVGGMVTNGLTHTDFRTFEGLSGFFLEFTKRVQAHYVQAFGPDSPQAKGNFRGTHPEPKVARAVFEQMLAEAKVDVRTKLSREMIFLAETVPGPGVRTITEVCFTASDGRNLSVRARVYVDATYEGDLMAAAGVAFRVGREGRAAFGESLAPDQPDDQLQAYNFRLTMTDDPANRVPFRRPDGYRREDFLPLVPLLDGRTIKTAYCENTGGVVKLHVPRLPNAKADQNDVSRSPVRMSLPGANLGWPLGDAAARRAIFAEHLRHNVGILYFLQNDEAVPAAYRDEARRWGLCRDEYPENDHLPEQLYVREARRMVGRHVFTQKDVDPGAPGELRAPMRPDSIATGDYGPNCHGTGHEGPRIGGKHTGEFYHPAPPYCVPYGVIVPNDVTNLLVPVAASSSHVGFCALRLEPIWCSLGQAAGHAAHLAIERNSTVQDVPVAQLQARLWAEGSATAYVSDVPPGHPDLAAVQWWATAGGLHGDPAGDLKPGARGKQIVGQYFEAFPGHAAVLDAPLDDATRARWAKLAAALNVREAAIAGAKTRGEFVRRAFAGRPVDR
ncbi:MAG TPA: FAD-dependent oxidoreductase [Humisphaera sp.]